MTSVITNKEELLSVVRKEYHNDSVEFSSAFFDFEVQCPRSSMPMLNCAKS